LPPELDPFDRLVVAVHVGQKRVLVNKDLDANLAVFMRDEVRVGLTGFHSP
jgi:hypothetical protein